MPKKMSVSEKWSDPWFRKLAPMEKLLFVYLCDVCDCAGFVEYDPELAQFQTKAPQEELEGAIKGLNPKVIMCGEWLWVVNHIKHQQDYPNKSLNPANKAHQGIWSRLNAHLDFEEVRALIDSMDVETRAGFVAINKPNAEGAGKGLTSPPSKGKGNGYGKGIGKGPEEGGPGETLLGQLEDFRAVHPECRAITETTFVAAVRACSENGAPPDVVEAIAAFQTDFADVASFRPGSPIREFKKYLRHSCRKVAEVNQSQKKKTARLHPALQQK